MTDPRWLALARADLGIRETPGIANNPLLMKRFASITKALGVAYNADSVPWCGAIMAYWMTQSGLRPPAIAIRAKSWATWGIAVPALRGLIASGLAPGVVLVFAREGGGHVALYVGEDDTHYHCLGGNQGDAITIARIPKARCIATRWPTGEDFKPHPVRLAINGAPISRSEA